MEPLLDRLFEVLFVIHFVFCFVLFLFVSHPELLGVEGMALLFIYFKFAEDILGTLMLLVHLSKKVENIFVPI